MALQGFSMEEPTKRDLGSPLSLLITALYGRRTSRAPPKPRGREKRDRRSSATKRTIPPTSKDWGGGLKLGIDRDHRAGTGTQNKS